MLVEACLVLITLSLVILTGAMVKISLQFKRATTILELDFHTISNEVKRLLKTLNEVAERDISYLSEEAKHFLTNLNSTSKDVAEKVRSLDFLFRPFQAFNSQTDSSNSSSSSSDTIPQILKWIASSAFLIKTAKEFIKNEK